MNKSLKDPEGFCSLVENKTFLITGASGFVGMNLIDYLLYLRKHFEINFEIIGMSRRKINIPGVLWVEHDVTRPLRLSKKIDFVIHGATPVIDKSLSSTDLLKLILNGTSNIVDFSLKNNVSNFLNLSSGAVYGEMPDYLDGFVENSDNLEMLFDLEDGYSTGKKISEMMVEKASKISGQSFINARCFSFSGKYLAIDKHFAIGNFVRDALRGSDIVILGDGKSLRSYLDGEDLAHWLLTILFYGKNGETYNVGSDEVLSIEELARLVSDTCKEKKINVSVLNKEPTLNRFRYFPCIKKASELGLFVSIPLQRSIENMFKFNKV